MAENYTNGAYHLADAANASYYQPVRKNNFMVSVDFSKLNLQDFGETSSAIRGDIAQKVVEFSVVKFNPPHFNQEKIEIKRGNSTINFADRAKWATDNDLVINDYYSGDGKSILMAWQRLSYNPETDQVFSSANYKTNINVFELLPDGTPIKQWLLEGCWVSKVSEDGWDNEANGKKTVTATIVYDRARMVAM